MRKIINAFRKIRLGKTVADLVDDIYKNPERYSIKSISPVTVYRDESFCMWVFDGGDVKHLGVCYDGFRAKAIHRALSYATRNGCTGY